MEISRRCEVCKIDVNRASYAKHLKSEKHLGNIKQDEVIIPVWLFKEEQKPIRDKIKKVYNPDTLKQTAGGNNKTK